MYGIIYLLTSPSNKCYVGQTVKSLPERWSNHVAETKLNRGCRHLNAAILKYGPESFHKDVIAEAESKERLDHLEKFWINMFQSNNPEFGYNLRDGGANGKQSEETKLKIGEAQIGNKNHAFGKVVPKETREKLSKALIGKAKKWMVGRPSPMLGKHHSIETKNKWSLARKGKQIGEKNPFYGQHHTEETKKRMSEAQKRRQVRERVAREILCQPPTI